LKPPLEKSHASSVIVLQPSFVTGLQAKGPPRSMHAPSDGDTGDASHWIGQSPSHTRPPPAPPEPLAAAPPVPLPAPAACVVVASPSSHESGAAINPTTQAPATRKRFIQSP
jgi:hypothetical protein